MALAAPLMMSAQFTPTTMWPYLNEDFSEGYIMYRDGTGNKASINIHLNAGELQFLKGDNILTKDLDDVEFATVDQAKFVPAEGKMMKVHYENKKGGYVLLSTLADLDALYSGSGAYGSSTNTQAVRSQTSIALGGMQVVSHAKLLEEKKNDGGSLLTTKEKLYIKVGEISSPAFQKDVETAFSLSGNAEWKAFLKKEKIKWRKAVDLEKVVDFLSNSK